MKRILFLGCLCLAFQLRGQGTSSTNAAALTRPAQRFLFLIDTSSAMSRQKTDTMDTMSRMILSAVGGRIQINDFLGLWTVDDQLHTDAIPSQRWDPQQRGELANHVYRYLRDKHFNKKNAILEKAMAAVAEEAQLSGTLNVLLFTDGSIPVKGTPFDDSINEIFAKHAAGMKKAKKPFVVVLITREGRFVAHAVSPGGGQIYIPRLPKAVAAEKKPVTTETAPAVTPTPGRALTPEEFTEILLPRRSNTVASTSAPLILRGGALQTNQATPEPFSQVATGTLAQVPAATVVAPETTASPDRSAAVTNVPAAIVPAPTATAPTPTATTPAPTATTPAPTGTTPTPTGTTPTPTGTTPTPTGTTPTPTGTTPTPTGTTPTPIATAPAPTATTPIPTATAPAPRPAAPAPSEIAPAPPTRAESSAPKVENVSAIAVPSKPPMDRVPAAIKESAGDDQIGTLANSPAPAQTALLAQQEPLLNAPIYLMAAVAFLLVAMVLALLYYRSIRYFPRPSIISRSLEKEKK